MSIKFIPNFSRFDRAVAKALNPTSVEFAKQANKYVKKDTGATEASVWTSSNFDSGKVIWGTDYASMIYYTGQPLKDKNPEASIRWAEVAKAQDLDAVREVAREAIKRNL